MTTRHKAEEAAQSIVARAERLGVTTDAPPWVPVEERGPQAPAVSSWEPVDLGPVVAGDRVTAPPVAFQRSDGIALLYDGRLNLFLGETESCKSWAAAVAVAQELDHEHHVLVVDFEDTPEALVERLRSLAVPGGRIAARLSYVQPAGRFDDVAQMVVAEMFATRGVPALVVVDGVTEAMTQVGLDPSKGPDVAAFYAGFPRSFARTGAAVVLTDHVTKDREGRGRWAIGSERKLSGLDGAAYGFEVLAAFGRERTGRVKITVSKDRCGHVRQHEGAGRAIALFELRSWPDGGVTTSLDPPDPAQEGAFRPTHVMESLSKAIETNPRLSVRALRGMVRSKAQHTDLALELLVNEGYVETEAGLRGARLHVSVRPFRTGAGPSPTAPSDGEDRGDDDLF